MPTPRPATRPSSTSPTRLLLRHGIVFRAALEAENCAPPWRELLYVYRRLEARGELRGGRFVQRFAGEQYAAPEALAMLRAQRREAQVVDLARYRAASGGR